MLEIALAPAPHQYQIAMPKRQVHRRAAGPPPHAEHPSGTPTQGRSHRSEAAFVIGVTIVRPSMLAASARGQAAAAAAPEEEGALLAEAGALRARAGAWGQVVAWLLAGATLAMAVGRYV